MIFQTVTRDNAKPTPMVTIEQINAVKFTSRQIEAAWANQAKGAAGRSRGRDVTALALAARTEALAVWTAKHDPRREWDAEAVLAAAAQFPIAMTADGYAFDAAGFQEMILFVEELPW